METIECRVAKVVFRSAENGFTILSCITDHDYITITGPMADVQPGVTLTVEGEWKTHPKYGRQMEADHWTCKTPQDLDGIELYLIRSRLWTSIPRNCLSSAVSARAG